MINSFFSEMDALSFSTMPSPHLVQHVSDTAYWIAAYRAKETQRKDALFRDPLAAALSQGRGEAIAKQMGNTKPMEWSIALRTVIIDRFILDAVKEGVDLVLNLGAGLDTRPYRLDVPAELRWVEVDFPPLIQMKDKTLQSETPRCQLRRMAIDLSRAEERNPLLAEINAQAKKILVLTEGVVPYLSLDEAASLADALAKQTQIVSWVTDYFSPFFMQLYRQGKISLQLKHAPFQFFPQNWQQFFLDHGWALQELRFLAEEGERVGRSMPAPLFAKLLLPLIPAKKKKEFQQMMGCALLGKIKNS
jgi:methyltransferase (TIGR00027 family)